MDEPICIRRILPICHLLHFVIYYWRFFLHVDRNNAARWFEVCGLNDKMFERRRWNQWWKNHLQFLNLFEPDGNRWTFKFLIEKKRSNFQCHGSIGDSIYNKPNWSCTSSFFFYWSSSLTLHWIRYIFKMRFSQSKEIERQKLEMHNSSLIKGFYNYYWAFIWKSNQIICNCNIKKFDIDSSTG